MKSLRREVEQRGPKVPLPPDVWDDRMKRLDALRGLVTKHIDRAPQRQAGHYNKGRQDVRFQVGDRVMRKAHVLSNGPQGISTKLVPKWEGPYEIIKVMPPNVYILCDNVLFLFPAHNCFTRPEGYLSRIDVTPITRILFHELIFPYLRRLYTTHLDSYI